MTFLDEAESIVGRCQGRPAAARPGYREDMLCASAANGVVRFGAVDIPVCKMHAATFARWGSEAESLARERWGWGAWSDEHRMELAVVAKRITEVAA